MKNNFIPFSLPSIGIEEERAVLEVLHSGWLTTGKIALAFEQEFASFTGCKKALAVNSATSGLLLAYNACGIAGGDKILTTPYTFTSTANAARHVGAEIEYADIEAQSYNIDPVQVEKKLCNDHEKRIKAIVPVHIGGNVCKMNEIIALAKQYNVFVIEDAAHAFPSKTHNGFAGTLGDIGVYSFYATKTITTAEGGMICTNNSDFAQQMELMRMHGIDRTVWNRYTSEKSSWEYDVIGDGWKCNLPDILAAIGREQLKKANSFYEKRKQIVAQYNDAFANSLFILPPDSYGNAWHLYLLQLDLQKLTISRNEFVQQLQQGGIGISVHFIPHFHLTYWKKRYNLQQSDFPQAQKRFEQTITLPLWPDMTPEMVEQVINTVISLGKKYAR